jgi:hypothetical protein
MSQKEVTLAMRVKKPVIIHPTSCAKSHHTTISSRSETRGDGGGRLIRRPVAQTLKYDVAILDERWALLGCLWREASRIRRHD